MYRYILLIVIFCLASTGCATVNLSYDPSILRFDTPEVNGKALSGSIGVNNGNTPSRVLGSLDRDVFSLGGRRADFDDSSDEYTKSTFTLGGRFDLGVLDTVDIYYRAALDAPHMIGVKYQLIGQGRSNNIVGLKVSISGEYGIPTKKKSKETPENFTRELSSYDMSVNIGYRINKGLIVYSNNFYQSLFIDGDLKRYSDVVYSKNGTTKILGTLVGLRLGQSRIGPYVGFEYGISRFIWPKTDDDNIVKTGTEKSYGINVGYAW